MPSTKPEKIFRADIDCRRLHEPIKLPDSNCRNIIEVRRKVVPIIFVPGIMGSRLRDEKGQKVWDPDSKIFMLGNFGLKWQSAKKRKAKLVGHAFKSEYLKVIEDDTAHNKSFADHRDPTRDKRGWGGVGWSSYGKFLIALQNRKWEPLIRLHFSLPVYAFGYNWTDCNGRAGDKLVMFIERLIKSYTDKGCLCDGVILVTHSMGGLVARAACKVKGIKEKVYGVIHGVQPAMGAAAGYWRMKGGFERPHTIPELDQWQWLHDPSKQINHKTETLITKGYDFGMGMNVGLGNVTAWVLGTDGKEVTSLLGNMPGGLELLPNKHYCDNDGNKQWLVFVNPDGKKTRLPKADPYEEIYRRKEEFYRLVNPDWLDPGNQQGEPDEQLPDLKDSWGNYLVYSRQAELFHSELKDNMHSDSYQFYSTGVASADRVVFIRTLDTLAAKGKRLLGIVKNEWFGALTSTALDETKRELSNPLTSPVKKTLKHSLFHGLTWKDVIFHPATAVEIAKKVPQAARDASSALKSAIQAYPGAFTETASGIPKAVGKGFLVTAAKNMVGLFVRDTEWYINKGGYQDRVCEDRKPTDDHFRSSSDVPPEAVYVITMKPPDGAGDGTVPESSARALNPFAHATVKYDKKGKKIRRTFSIGDKAGAESEFVKKKAPRTMPKLSPDFDEAWFDRGHEPIYKSKSAQDITFRAIENICRRRIAEHVRR